jgi:pyruvate dehydrogenase E1 component alpha subunit
MQLSREALVRAYSRMRTIRAFEDRIHVENRTGEIAGFIHLYNGQEAIAVGVCENLTDRDYIASTHRGHGHCIAKGCDVPSMMMEIYGRHAGLCKGRGGSMHIADLDKGMLGANAIVGGGPPIALGAAIAAKIRKDKTVAVSFTGDGGSNQGTVFEAMNMAVVLKVPKIFVFENNGYGEHTGASYAVGSDIASRAEGFGMPVFKADGFDFFSVHDAARSAVERAREGGGPSVVYAEGTRYGGHYEGDPQSYREKGESERLKSEKDCLMVFRNRVTSAGLLDAAELDRIDEELDQLIDRSVADAKASSPPPLNELHADVYVSY